MRKCTVALIFSVGCFLLIGCLPYRGSGLSSVAGGLKIDGQDVEGFDSLDPDLQNKILTGSWILSSGTDNELSTDALSENCWDGGKLLTGSMSSDVSIDFIRTPAASGGSSCLKAFKGYVAHNATTKLQFLKLEIFSNEGQLLLLGEKPVIDRSAVLSFELKTPDVSTTTDNTDGT